MLVHQNIEMKKKYEENAPTDTHKHHFNTYVVMLLNAR